jgi:4-azaleucine resistance transporter AzlC
MEPKEMRIREGIKTGMPIFIGYFPMAMAFGLLAKATGINFLATISFSVFVFAGASQFMAINLLSTGAAAGEIILATFLLNFRHLLMSASVASRLKEQKSRWLPFIAFGVTDETFAVASTLQGKPNLRFLLGLEGISYSGWVGGTIVGYWIGASLPVFVQASMGITLYAMFAAILIPQFRKSLRIVLLAIGSGGLHFLIVALKIVSEGWSLIIAMVLAAALGALFFKDGEEVPL